MRRPKRAGWAAKLLLLPLLLPQLLSAGPAAAEIVTTSDTGFVVRLTTEVTAPPVEAWRTMTSPALWWSGQQTFSGDAANLTFEPVVGGCFCETLPSPAGALLTDKAGSPKPGGLKTGSPKPGGPNGGGVQHMRVVYIEPPRAMRLTGALGPLQSEALSATMTMTIKPTEKGSRILFEYVVGGFMRYKVEDIAPAVDRMLAAQLQSLAGKLGPIVQEPALIKPAAPKSEGAAGPPDSAAELPLVPVGAGAIAPLSGAGNYSLPPARRTAPVTVARPQQPPAKVAAKPAPLPGSAAVPVAKVAAKPPATSDEAPAKVKAAQASNPRGKAASKPASKPAPKAPRVDDEAHRDANAAFDALLGAAPQP